MARIRAAGIAAAMAAGLTAGLAFRAYTPASPTVEDIQAAYDREAVVSDDKHDKGLKIVGVDCASSEKRKFTCQVGFTKAEEGERVFLDAALLEKNPLQNLKLLRGLCKRLL